MPTSQELFDAKRKGVSRRYRLIVEFDTTRTPEGVRSELRNSLAHGRLAECVPGEIVYVASDTADTAVISHDGKILTRG